MSSENQQVLRLRLAYLMHRFLLIALGMGFLLPTAASAESFWLILSESSNTHSALEKIEMGSMEQCIKEGSRFKQGVGYNGSEKGFPGKNKRQFICITGK